MHKALPQLGLKHVAPGEIMRLGCNAATCMYADVDIFHQHVELRLRHDREAVTLQLCRVGIICQGQFSLIVIVGTLVVAMKSSRMPSSSSFPFAFV